MPVTTQLEGTVQRLALNQSSRVGVVDDLSSGNVLLWQGATAQFQCAMFRGVPSENTLVNNVMNIAEVELVVRKTNAAGTVLINQVISDDDVDLTLSYADWLAGNDEHFTFELSDAETNQTVPDSGHLQIYFAIFVTTSTNRYLAGFGYGEIINVGIENTALPPPPVETPYVLTVSLLGTSAVFSGNLAVGGTITAGALNVNSNLVSYNQVFDDAFEMGVRATSHPLTGRSVYLQQFDEQRLDSLLGSNASNTGALRYDAESRALILVSNNIPLVVGIDSVESARFLKTGFTVAGLTTTATLTTGGAATFGGNVTFSANISSPGISGTINPLIGLAGLNFIDARWYGVDTTGVTDSTVTFNLARAAARTARRPLFWTGTVAISSTLVITSQETWHGDCRDFQQAGATTLKWIGALNGTMVSITGGGVFKDHRMDGIIFEGNSLAGIPLLIDSAQQGSYTNLYFKSFTITGLKTVSTNDSCKWNDFRNITFDGNPFTELSPSPTSCMYIHGGGGGNSCHNRFYNIFVSSRGTTPGLRLGNCDNNSFFGLYHFTVDPTTAKCVLVEPALGSNMPSNNYFYHLQGNWEQPGTTEANPGMIFGYDTSNGQLPAVMNGSAFLGPVHYSTGNITGIGSIAMSNVLDITGQDNINDIESTGVRIRPTGSQPRFAQFLLMAYEYDHVSNFTSTYIQQGGATANLSAFPTLAGVSRVNLSSWWGINTSGILIGTNGNVPITLATNNVVRAQVTDAGLVVGGGTAISKIIKANIVWDIPSTGSPGLSFADFAVTGAAVGDHVTVTPSGAFSGVITADIVGANSVRLAYFNFSGSTINPASYTYQVLIFKF